MDPRPEQEARVRGQPEGRTVEAEEWLVHGDLPRPMNGNDRGRDDDDHFLGVDAELAALEEPAEDRDAPQDRDLALSLVSLSVRTPPMTSRSPSCTMTSFSDRRLKIGGLPSTACAKLGSLFSTSPFIRIRVRSASRMTLGVTSSLSSASLNCTCVPPKPLWLTYGTSKPRAMTAVEFSTVTVFGSASDRALPCVSSAWIARLKLKLRPTMPNSAPSAGLARVGRDAVGRFTTLPPVGSAVEGSTGKIVFPVTAGLLNVPA